VMAPGVASKAVQGALWLRCPDWGRDSRSFGGRSPVVCGGLDGIPMALLKGYRFGPPSIRRSQSGDSGRALAGPDGRKRSAEQHGLSEGGREKRMSGELEVVDPGSKGLGRLSLGA